MLMVLALVTLVALAAAGSPASSTATAAADDPGWTPVTGLAHSMTMVIEVDRSGALMADTEDRLAVFAGSEVRGAATSTNLGGRWVFFLTAGSNADGEALSFRFYDASADEIIALCEGLTFRADAARGSVASPWTLHERSGVAPDCALSWAVAPGFSSTMTIYASVHFSGVRTDDPADRVAAISGNEIRGVGVPFSVDGRQVYAIETWGDVDGESLSFRLYEASTGDIREALETTNYLDGLTLGSPSAPFHIDADVLLPVEIVLTRALAETSKVVLTWEIDGGSATGVARGGRPIVGFVVERRSVSAGSPPQREGDDIGIDWIRGPYVDRQADYGGGRYTASIDALEVGFHRFRVRVVHAGGDDTWSNALDVTIADPTQLTLSAPYPHPARNRASLVLAQPASRHAEVALFDVTGRQVATLFSGIVPANTPQSIEIDTRLLAGGRYTVVAASAAGMRSRALVVVR